jgi:DNA-binding Xre family transcriptional regulator
MRYNKNMQDLSLMVRKKRGELGLRKAADEIGITHTTLSRIESGKVPDLKTFGLVCEWLGVEPNQILGFKSPSQSKQSNRNSQPVAHYRAQKTMGPETAQHLGVLITKIHETVSQRAI